MILVSMFSCIDKVLVFIFGTIFSIPPYSTAKCRGMRASYSFDIYDALRDHDYCGAKGDNGRDCNWSVRSSGPCLIVNKRVKSICYRWK
ncbi:hypothetical protein Patl1_25856 [Pistacia atlantica]|uniref:Uncharacterized protein n=1 Tax=Pistacia atlantica TaxID=434234 RepID=A0ACC1AZW4_9ROSI|nr:hypothetical protein Patl1_25856 [Pistacia atlantica]